MVHESINGERGMADAGMEIARRPWVVGALWISLVVEIDGLTMMLGESQIMDERIQYFYWPMFALLIQVVFTSY